MPSWDPDDIRIPNSLRILYFLNTYTMLPKNSPGKCNSSVSSRIIYSEMLVSLHGPSYAALNQSLQRELHMWFVLGPQPSWASFSTFVSHFKVFLRVTRDNTHSPSWVLSVNFSFLDFFTFPLLLFLNYNSPSSSRSNGLPSRKPGPVFPGR